MAPNYWESIAKYAEIGAKIWERSPLFRVNFINDSIYGTAAN